MVGMNSLSPNEWLLLCGVIVSAPEDATPDEIQRRVTAAQNASVSYQDSPQTTPSESDTTMELDELVSRLGGLCASTRLLQSKGVAITDSQLRRLTRGNPTRKVNHCDVLHRLRDAATEYAITTEEITRITQALGGLLSAARHLQVDPHTLHVYTHERCPWHIAAALRRLDKERPPPLRRRAGNNRADSHLD